MKYYLLFACLIGTILISGCINQSFDATEIAKTNQAVKSFLADYPNARVIASYVSNANISSECENSQLAAKDYWKVSIFDEATNLTVNVWVDATTRNVVCLIKTGGGTTTTTTTTTITTTTIIETTSTTEERSHGASGGGISNKCSNVTCENRTLNCPDGFISNCQEICNSETGTCNPCFVDCSEHEKAELVKTFDYKNNDNAVVGIALDDSYLYVSLGISIIRDNCVSGSVEGGSSGGGGGGGFGGGSDKCTNANQSEIDAYEKGSWDLKTTFLMDSPLWSPDIIADENYVYACGFNGTDTGYVGNNKPALYIWKKDGTRIAKYVIDYIKPNYSISACSKIAVDENKIYLLIGSYLLTFDKNGNKLNTLWLKEQNETGVSVSMSYFADMIIDDKNIYLGMDIPAEMQIWDKNTLMLKQWIKFYKPTDTYVPGFESMAIDDKYVYVSMATFSNSVYKNINILDKNGSLVSPIDHCSCSSMSTDDNYLYCGTTSGNLSSTSGTIFVNGKTPQHYIYGGTLLDYVNKLTTNGVPRRIVSDQNYIYARSDNYPGATSIQIWKK